MNLNKILNITIAILFTLLIFKYVYKNSRFINSRFMNKFTTTDDIIGNEESNKNLKLLMDSIVDIDLDCGDKDINDCMTETELTEKLKRLNDTEYTINIPIDNININEMNNQNIFINNKKYSFYPINTVVPFYLPGDKRHILADITLKRLIHELPDGFLPCNGKKYSYDTGSKTFILDHENGDYETPDFSYRFLISPNYNNDSNLMGTSKINDTNDIVSNIIKKLNEKQLPPHQHKLAYFLDTTTYKLEHNSKRTSSTHSIFSTSTQEKNNIYSGHHESPFLGPSPSSLITKPPSHYYYNNMPNFINMIYIIKKI